TTAVTARASGRYNSSSRTAPRCGPIAIPVCVSIGRPTTRPLRGAVTRSASGSRIPPSSRARSTARSTRRARAGPACPTSRPKAPGKDVKPAAKITWWHAHGGINGEALNRIVDSFNKSQSNITVEAVFQGSYDDLLAKLNTALASNSAPALVQVYDIGQRYMYDSGEIVPMQAFIDRDKFDTSDFEPAVINYYKF